ncbi:hypothetical protein IMY05_C4891000300 [Salix suchowensis]|nr:hypothetical protein IMY05_C4891000300 [Salix suchowensis]
MPSSGLAVLVDNTGANFTFNSPWSLSCRSLSGLQLVREGNGTLGYGFEGGYCLRYVSRCYHVDLGTAIAFYGHADGQLLASNDGASPTYHPPGLQFQIYQQWFKFADLADTHHDISLGFSTNVYFDYAVISAGQSTPLQGRSILVDDSDAAMNYTGLGASGLTRCTLRRRAAANTTRKVRSSKLESGGLRASSVHRFVISVYGIVQWQNPGRISTAYTLDGSGSPQTTTFSSDGQRKPYTDQPNYLFYHADLTPGNHTLVITVTEITDQQSFLLDYILYTAAFDSLAQCRSDAKDIHPWTPPRIWYGRLSRRPTPLRLRSHFTSLRMLMLVPPRLGIYVSCRELCRRHLVVDIPSTRGAYHALRPTAPFPVLSLVPQALFAFPCISYRSHFSLRVLVGAIHTPRCA